MDTHTLGTSISRASTSFVDAAGKITSGLNSNLQVAAVTSGSSIAPETVSFMGYVNEAQLYVTSRSRQAPLNSAASSPDMALSSGSQIIDQHSGNARRPRTYSFLTHAGSFSTPELMTETYGVLTVGAVDSGTVALGQEVTGAGVLPLTAIDGNLSGSGPGSHWIVNNAQTVASDHGRHDNDGDSPPGRLELANQSSLATWRTITTFSISCRMVPSASITIHRP